MAWTRSGTISLTNGSAVVYGSGTTWVSGGLARPGDTLKAPDGKDYEVLSVQSNTQLTLVSGYLGSTASGQAYALVHTGLLPSEIALAISSLQSKYLTTVAQLYEWETSAADTVPITNPATGVTSNVKPLQRFLASLTDGSSAGVFSSLTTAAIKESAGNLGLGVVPSAWDFGGNLQFVGGGFITTSSSIARYGANFFYDSFGPAYVISGPASMYQHNAGAHQWFSAPSGTEGSPAAFTQQMMLDASGNLLVGVTSGSSHTLAKSVAHDSGNLVFRSYSVAYSFEVYGVSGYSASGSNAATKFGFDAVTGRSINAGGTINASGADYAEYERNNGLKFTKGDLVGFAADGTLTKVFADAVRFAVKSTNPSYVGGDTWGTEDQVGKRPEQPVYEAPDFDGPPLPEAPEDTDDAEYQAQLAAHQAAMDSHELKVHLAEATHAVKVERYEADKAVFEAKLEEARQLVDRIAYSGKVPCNVTGAIPGGYIIAVEGEDGGIVGQYVADPDFGQYKRAVGRVNRILDDGRCEVAVIIH